MTTPFFPHFRPRLAPMGSRTTAAARSLAHDTLAQIEHRLGPALDHSGFLSKPAANDHSRERIFTLSRTFWCWIWQVLQANTSCREVVLQVQALFATFTAQDVDEGTSAYCRARKKLPLSLLEKAFEVSHRSAQKYSSQSSQLQGRPLKAIDGSGVRLWDSPENQKAFPSSKNQYSKPSFPILKMVALFSAASGALLARATGRLNVNELRLFISLAHALAPKDILTGDRFYGSFVVAAWLQTLQVDLVARLSTLTRKVDFGKACKQLGPHDGWFIWKKPSKPSALLPKEQWEALPQEITVRIIHSRIEKPGFRTREVTVVTTLLDAQLYPAHEILNAYLKRWRLEMCLDDLKTTLGMEMLSCRSPNLVERELLVFLITHNLLRWMMAQAAQQEEVQLERISFKGSLDAFRQWSSAMTQVRGDRNKGKRKALWRKFLKILVADLVPARPGRQEPRAVKKRSKYPVLNKPRRQFVERWSRNKRRRVARAKKKDILK